MTEFGIRPGFPRVHRSRSLFSNGLLKGNLARAPIGETRLALVIIADTFHFVVIGHRHISRLQNSGVDLGS